MESILQDIEKALDCGLYYIALQSTLALPDICAALESPTGDTTGRQYTAWYDTNVSSKYNIALTGSDCWRFRCSYLHRGSIQDTRSSYNRILFVIPNPMITMHNNIINDALNIDINIFCRMMIEAVRNWQTAAANNENYIRNYPNLIKVYPNGISPYICGIPVIS